MAFTPSSVVYLCGVPLESDLKNQLTFSDRAAQTAYFQNNIKKQYTNFTYQRKDNILRVPANIDDLYNCNYVMYQNANFGSKWFYAFIVDREYINPNCTHLTLKTDPFQTYMFDVTYYPSFIVREHVSVDDIGAHTVPEPLQIGEAIANSRLWTNRTYLEGYVEQTFDSNYYAAIFTSDVIFPNDTIDPYTGGNANAAYIIAPSQLSDLQKIIDHIVAQDKKNAIVGIIPIPKHYVFATAHTASIPPDTITYYSLSDNANATEDITINPGYQTLDGYTPRNKKLFTYPFYFCQIKSSDGNSKIFRYERLGTASSPIPVPVPQTAQFQTFFSLSMNPSIVVYPYNYNGQSKNADNAVTYSAGFKPIPYTYDVYAQWYAANKNTIAYEKFQKGFSLAKNILTGNVGGAINSAENILGYMSRMDDREDDPRQVSGAIDGSNAVYAGAAGIDIYAMSIKAEYARIVDDFFTMFGYQINRVRDINFNTRPNWNYIHTNEINIAGDVPDDDLNNLKSMFNNGVTMWHNPQTFGNYSQPNAPT